MTAPQTPAGRALLEWTEAAFPGTPAAMIAKAIAAIEREAAAAERERIRALAHDFFGREQRHTDQYLELIPLFDAILAEPSDGPTVEDHVMNDVHD